MPPPTTAMIGTKQCRGKTRFKTSQLIRDANKNTVHARDASAHFIGCVREKQCTANDNADVIEAAQQRKHQHREPEPG